MTNHLGPILAQRDNLTAIDCHACGYAHLTQFPTEAELAKFYTSDFWQREKAGALAEFERAAEWWDMTHGDWLSVAEQHVSGIDLLDIGSGYGFFVDTARKNLWNPWGIEPNAEAVAYANSIGWFPWDCSWDDWYATHGEEWRFDCVSAHWVIEHLPDPKKFLCQARHVLRPGGVLLAVIPQEWTEAQAEANNVVTNKAWWLHHTHINYFSQTSFANLLGRAGFRIVDMLASYPMEKFVTDIGSNYVDNPDLGSLCHRAVERFELSQTREKRIEAARERARFHGGRDLIVIAKKD